MRSPPDQGQMISCNERSLWKQIIAPLGCLQDDWRNDARNASLQRLVVIPFDWDAAANLDEKRFQTYGRSR